MSEKRYDVPVFPQWMYDAELADGMSPALAAQEYDCSPEGPNEESVYGDLLMRAVKEGRTGEWPWQEQYPVETAWDFGVSDHTVVWFLQQILGWFHAVDYLEGSGESLPYWLAKVHEKPYSYIRHHAPHDLGHRQKWSANSGIDVSSKFGVNFTVNPKLLISEGISATRTVLARTRFNTANPDVARGFENLKSYRYLYDQQHDELMDQPVHNKASHTADGFRTYAVGRRIVTPWAKSGPLHRPLPRR